MSSPSPTSPTSPSTSPSLASTAIGPSTVSITIRPFSLIVCTTADMGIGFQGTMPWNIREELLHFRQTTCGTGKNTVIMGRRTWDSLPVPNRPLKNRKNIVISRDPLLTFPGAHHALSLTHALAMASENAQGEIFVIGGGSVYAEAIQHPQCVKIHRSLLEPLAGQEWKCDTFFPSLDRFTMAHHTIIRRETYRFHAQVWIPRVINFEQQYLDLVYGILYSGRAKEDRTGTGTLSVFGPKIRMDLRNHQFPLLTTKHMFIRGIFEELKWFLAGHTDAKLLAAKNVHIWDANGSREALDRQGLVTREEGDLGPIYGFQWRHFGAEYKDCHTDYTGQGVDQLQKVVEDLKTQPHSRRILMSAWNPRDLAQMALPPCHCLCQFYVNRGELCCQMYQRSGDVGLGVPFNMASYALLTIMLAHVCGLEPGELHLVLGDAHVYMNHVEALKEQVCRDIRTPPKLFIKRAVTRVEDFVWEDFELTDYHPHESIAMPLSV